MSPQRSSSYYSRHLLVYVCFGQPIETICFDPTEGGAVKLKGGILPPAAGLPMGYLFNIIVGGLLTYCGFDTLASKIASFVRPSCMHAWQAVLTHRHSRRWWGLRSSDSSSTQMELQRG